MPFCPECHDEFEYRVAVCPDCNVALEEKLAPTLKLEKKKDEPLVQIATAPNESIAMMWAGVLEEYDIHCLLKGLQIGGWTVYTPAFEMLHHIYVLESEADRARELLTRFLKN